MPGGYQRASLRQSRWCITSHARCPTRACREPCCNGPAERRLGSIDPPDPTRSRSIPLDWPCEHHSIPRAPTPSHELPLDPALRRGGSGYRRSRRATRRTLGGVVGRPPADAAASFAPAELRLHDARSGATRVGFRSVERAGGGGGDADGGIWFGGRAVCRTRRQRATDAALRRAGGGRGEHSSHLTRNARTSKREGGPPAPGLPHLPSQGFSLSPPPSPPSPPVIFPSSSSSSVSPSPVPATRSRWLAGCRCTLPQQLDRILHSQPS